jgi:hypothetical protein
MNWFNYHHLLYFWTVAKTGSITARSEGSPVVASNHFRADQDLRITVATSCFARPAGASN